MSDVALRMYTATQDNYIIVPTISIERNWGFDGSGEYCPKIFINDKRITAGNYNYVEQTIDSSPHFVIKEDLLNENNWNRRVMNEFNPLSFKGKLKMKMKLA